MKCGNREIKNKSVGKFLKTTHAEPELIEMEWEGECTSLLVNHKIKFRFNTKFPLNFARWIIVESLEGDLRNATFISFSSSSFCSPKPFLLFLRLHQYDSPPFLFTSPSHVFYAHKLTSCLIHFSCYPLCMFSESKAFQILWEGDSRIQSKKELLLFQIIHQPPLLFPHFLFISDICRFSFFLFSFYSCFIRSLAITCLRSTWVLPHPFQGLSMDY